VSRSAFEKQHSWSTGGHPSLGQACWRDIPAGQFCSSGAGSVAGKSECVDDGQSPASQHIGMSDLSIDLSPRAPATADILFRRWKTNGVKVGD
jgi:hypothetical protein